LILFFKQAKTQVMMNMTSENIKIASLIQNDIESISHPFKQMADSCGLTEKEFIILMKKLWQEGYIRKFGAVLHHQKAGYKKNSLIIWSVTTAKIEKTGKIFSSFPFVSHCYERKPAFQGKYNLFTMLHGKDEDISFLANKMAVSAKIHDFIILETLEEYKKTSPEYF
jgi:DNA-binding Lrp family transcriptional regulator